MRFLLLLAALLLAPATAHAADDHGAEPVTGTTSAAPLSLFVELVVNGQATGALANVAQDGDRLMVAARDLTAAGVVAPPGERIDVAHWAGVHTTYDAAGQRLLIDVPPALLPTRHITAAPIAMAAPLVDGGALLNYDLYVQHGNGRTTASLLTEQRAFGRWGMVSNTGILSTGPLRGYTRFDTRYSYVDERRAIEVNAGDLITRALSWTGAVRIGGIQFGRNFALRPDLITVPLPSFAGEAAVPTGVDLFVNGYHQSTTNTAPGRFVLDQVPVVNGAGEARIVTTDAVGREIATVIPFYVAPELLRPGLTDFSVEVGALRHNYGLKSFDYRRLVASGSVRHGLTAAVTLSGHLEATAGMINGGVGAAWLPGRWGAISGSVLASRTAGTTGTQLTAGYSYTSRRFSIGAEHVVRSSGFTDLGGFDLGRFAGSRTSDRVSLSLPIRGIGSFGAGYIAARQADGQRLGIASASLSIPLGARASAFAAVDHDLHRRFSIQLRIVIPLGGSTVASAGIARDSDTGMRVQASAARSIPVHGGFGFSADAARNGDGRFLGQASADWRGDSVQLEAGAATNGRDTSLWGSARGSLALLHGGVYAANALPGSFAVVATGMGGVPVYYENQRIGQTDRRGRLFVPNVTAYHAGSFAIDPVALPINAVADRVETHALLRAGAGAVIQLPVRRHLSVTARLVDVAGQVLAPGTVATLNGQASATVGWEGVLLIDGQTGAVAIDSTTAEGKPCHAMTTVADGVANLSDLGVIVCR